jgi:hypothetical protein
MSEPRTWHSETERLLEDAVRLGETVTACGADLDRDDPADCAGWGAARTVRSGFLVELLTADRSATTEPPRALRLRGARITGNLNLERLTLPCPIEFDRCCFEAPIRLDRARAPSLWLSGCRLQGGLSATGLETDGAVFLAFISAPQVRLSHARVGGQLVLNGAQLTNPGGDALAAYDLHVNQSMLCVDRFRAEGRVHLAGARIDGQLLFNGARLRNKHKHALDGYDLRVGQSLLCIGLRAKGELHLTAARIGGQFSLSAARLTHPGPYALDAYDMRVAHSLLCVDGFRARGRVHIGDAHIGGQLNLSGATIINENERALSAYGLRFDHGLICQELCARGKLLLTGARIGGQLNLDGAELSNPKGPALEAHAVSVGVNMSCKTPFTAAGRVILTGARIAGRLGLEGAKICSRVASALVANRIDVQGSLDCQGLEVDGGTKTEAAVQLRGAQVAEELVLTKSELTNPAGPALSADRLHVDRDVACDAMTAVGDLRFRAARIGGSLNFAGADLHDLRLERAQAATLTLPSNWVNDIVVDLTDAHVGQLDDSWPRASAPYRPRLTGLTYERLGKESADAQSRLEWVEQGERQWVEQGGRPYLPDAYDQLEMVFRQTGREDDARKVAMAKQRRRRNQLKLPGRVWNRFLAWSVGYGYMTWLALLWLAAVVLVGFVAFEIAAPEHMKPLKSAEASPDFHAWLYSLDAVLPLVKLGQEEFWTPTGLFLGWYVFSVLAGWVLVTAVLAALTAALFRE